MKQKAEDTWSFGQRVGRCLDQQLSVLSITRQSSQHPAFLDPGTDVVGSF